MMWGVELDPLPSPDILVKEGTILSIGNMKFEVFHRPAIHREGYVCMEKVF